MPKKNKTLCVDDLRHAEYYGMQPVFDELYHRSLEGENFTDLMDLILSRDNILLAYRNIKANGGSYTAGTDNKNISDIGCLPPETVAEKVRFIVTGSQHGYRPKPVRRKDIPKPNGKTRPLGIPCIWDRLVQQCIKQVIEPICEAKFSDNSYGFRPNRSVEHAVQKTYTMLQRMNLHYVIEFDIKGFFDNVNHSKLMRQIWAMGIHDKQLIFIIKRILKAPIRMPDGTTLIPDKGTPQGGIISPLLANIVLNELDKWVESQWQNHPLVKEYGYERKIRNSITFDRSKAFLKMRKTGLKEMYIVRYVTQENGMAKLGDILYRGSEEQCRALMGRLQSGELTADQVKELYAQAQQAAEQPAQDSVFSKLSSEQQQEMTDSIKAMLQTLIDADVKTGGEVTQGTLDAIQTQGFVLSDDGTLQRAGASPAPEPQAEAPALDPAAEPVVTILFSESPHLETGQQMYLRCCTISTAQKMMWLCRWPLSMWVVST